MGKKSSKEKYHMDVPYNEIPLEVNSILNQTSSVLKVVTR